MCRKITAQRRSGCIFRKLGTDLWGFVKMHGDRLSNLTRRGALKNIA
jgi:hypothetical protein